MKPSIGRIVHYVIEDHSPGACGMIHCAAIVTDVLSGNQVSLTVFPPPGLPRPPITRHPVSFDETADPHTWHWPEREE